MSEHFHYNVEKLERTRIMNIALDGLPVGEFRDLSEEELKTLFKLIENSSSEANPNSKTKKKHSGGGQAKQTKQTKKKSKSRPSSSPNQSNHRRADRRSGKKKRSRSKHKM